MSNHDSIDREDWRDYASNSELDEYLSVMAGLYDMPGAVEDDFEEYVSESFDPDDRYGMMREDSPVFTRIGGNVYRS
jgi:hypothetical protein